MSFGGGGFFGGGADQSSAVTKVSNKTDTRNISGAASEGALSIVTQGNVELVDPNLVAGAFGFAGQNLDLIRDLATRSFALQESLNVQSADAAQDYAAQLRQFGETAIKDDSERMTEIMKWGVVAVVIVVGVRYWGKGKRP